MYLLNVPVIENLSGDLIDASIDYKLFVNKSKFECLELCYMPKFATTTDFFSTVVTCTEQQTYPF